METGRSCFRATDPQRLPDCRRGSGLTGSMTRFLFSGCLVVLAVGLAASIALGLLRR